VVRDEAIRITYPRAAGDAGRTTRRLLRPAVLAHLEPRLPRSRPTDRITDQLAPKWTFSRTSQGLKCRLVFEAAIEKGFLVSAHTPLQALRLVLTIAR
jgi:hypothetical protein